MGQAAASMLPFALAGAFLPTWTTHVIIMLGTGRPRLNAWTFILGNAVYRFALGLGLLFGFRADALVSLGGGGRGPADRNPALYAIAALVCVALALLLGLRRPKARSVTPGVPGWIKALDHFPWYLAFAWGLLDVAAPGIQYVYFLGGIGALKAAGLPPAEEIILLAGFAVALNLMLAAPVVVYSISDRSQVVLARFKAWLFANGRTVSALILGAVGIYLALIALGIIGR